MHTTTLTQVPLTAVLESPLNPRQHFDATKLDELAASIRAEGILTPLLMRPVDANGKGPRYEIAAGHRRFRAAKLAQLETVPAIVRPMADDEFLRTLTIENLQRDDLHPLEEAQGFRSLLDLPGYDVGRLAAEVAKSETYVYQRLHLLQLIAPARKLFLDGQLTTAHAVHLARLQPADQKAALASWVFNRHDGVGPVRQLVQWIEQEIHADLHGAPWKKDDATLVPSAGACTTCPKRTGYTPALFADIAKKDTCTDRTCFHAKREAFLDRRRAELAAEHPRLVRISTQWSHGAVKKGAPLPSGQWWEAKKSDPKALVGLFVDGPDAGKTRYVTLERPKGTGGAAINPTWQAEQKRTREKRARETARRRRIFDAVRAKLPSTLDTDALRLLAVGYLDEMQQDAKRLLIPAAGLPPAPKSKRHTGYDYDGHLKEAVAAMSEPALRHFLQVLPLARDLTVWSWDASSPQRLLAAAKRVGVDVDAITRALAAEVKAKEAKKAKLGKAKAATVKKPAKREAGAVRRAAKQRKAKRAARVAAGA